jgi:hypothetical protein
MWETRNYGRRRCHWPRTPQDFLEPRLERYLSSRFCFSGRTRASAAVLSDVCLLEQVPLDVNNQLETPLFLIRRLRPHGGMTLRLLHEQVRSDAAWRCKWDTRSGALHLKI